MNLPQKMLAERSLILIVDDNPSVLAALEYFLSTIGYATLRAEDGRTALELAAAQPRLILLDVDMPGMSGIAVCEAIRDDPELSHLPVVMMTGRPTREVVSRATAAGALAVLAKPFDLELLQAILARHALPPGASSDAPASSGRGR